MKFSFKLFIPTIAISVYTLLDKTLIGLLIEGEQQIISDNGKEIISKISDIENGYYEQAEKIVKMVLTIITSLGTVMIPRNSNELSKGNYETFNKNLEKYF